MMELCIGTRSVRGTRMKSTDPRFFDTVVFPMLRLRTRIMAETTFPGFPSASPLCPSIVNHPLVDNYYLQPF
jgi:hypothetical protein